MKKVFVKNLRRVLCAAGLFLFSTVLFASASIQVDSFDAAGALWFFQGTGATETHSIDTADFQEGTGSLRVNCTFSAGAGNNVELLNNYNLRTQDWNFLPYGISICVKGTPGSTDVFRILLFEDLNMNGAYLDAGEEIWYYDSPTALQSGNWNKLLIPFSSFSLFAPNGGNASLDLNRIRAWDLRINSNGTAHSATVRIDDMRVVTAYSQAPNDALLNGSFFQLWNSSGCSCGGWTQARWEQEFQTMKDLCQDTAIIQYSVWQNTGSDVGWYPTNLAGITYKDTALDKIMAAAQAKNMKVFIGTYFHEDWNTFTKTDAAYYSALYAKQQTVIDELWTRYSANPAFYGWYIPQEVDDLNWQAGSAKTLVINYFKNVSDYCKTKSAAKPVMIASFFALYQPADVEQQWWNDFFATATNIDINAPQDGVGAGHVQSGAQVAQYLTAIKNACDANGVTFGVDVESFTPAWQPTDINTFKGQLWTAGALSNFLVQFEWANMEPSLGGLNQALYNDYQAYAQSAGCGATNTNTPTVTATVTPTVTRTASWTTTPTFTMTGTASFTRTHTATATQTLSASVTQTVSMTLTPSVTLTPTEESTFTLTPTQTQQGTATQTPTITDTYTSTPTVTQTSSGTHTQTCTQTQTQTPTATVSQTFTGSPTQTLTLTDTQTETITPSATESPELSSTPTFTQTPSQTVSETVTETFVVTLTHTPGATQTITHTAQASETQSPTQTQTQTASETITQTFIVTLTHTPSATQTGTQTAQASATDSPTQTQTQTAQAASPTVTGTNTPQNTSTPTATCTPTTTPTLAPNTPTATNTITATRTEVPAATFTPVPTATLTRVVQAYDDGQGPKELFIFPNPAKDKITILYSFEDGIDEGVISVYTASYRLVQRIAVKKEKSAEITGGLQYYIRMGIAKDLSAGVYFVCLRAGEKKVIKKLILLR